MWKTTKIGWSFIYMHLSVSPYFGVSILVTTVANLVMADSTSSPNDQESERESRSKLIEHAVKCLTKAGRSTSVCVKRDHVARVWEQLHECGADTYFTEEERQEIEEAIGNWECFHDSQVQTREPYELRVCYLCGEDPIHGLKDLVQNGVLQQNIWAINEDSKTWNVNSDWSYVKLFKGDILSFLKDYKGRFDIIYFDSPLPAKRNTLKVIGYVFLQDKLTSPGALITNFSFPPEQENSLSSQEVDNEKEMTNFLVKEYMKYRLCNVLGKDNSPENNAEYLSDRTDEDNYGDYVTFQVIDSAYLFIPAQRMLTSKKGSLWDQIFINKEVFLEEIDRYFSSNVKSATKGTYKKSTKTTRRNVDSEKSQPQMGFEPTNNKNSKRTTRPQELMKLLKDLKEKYNFHARNNLFFNLRKMAECFLEKSNDYSCCKAWLNDIFPSLKDQKIKMIIFLTPLLFSSSTHILDFSNQDFASRCLEPLFKAVADGRFPSCGNTATPEQATCLVAGLLYGQMACPSFPVMDKLFRLRYTAKEKQMFADVFVFDKCRYLYDQFPTVDCAGFAIVEPKQQIVFRMVVDGLCKHLGGICCEDLFKFCNIASKDAIVEGGVSFPNSHKSIPDRQEIKQYILLKEKAFGLVKVKEYKKAIEIYYESLFLFPVSLQDTILANIADCFLSLGLLENVVSICNEALKINSEHVMAHFRRAKAFKMMGHYRWAIEDLKVVLKETHISRDEPGNKEAKRELLECQHCQMYVCDTHWFYFSDPKLSALDK